MALEILHNLDLSNLHIVIRIILSIALGFIIGLERELTNKWAGLRTHILVCLGSTVFTILSIYSFPIIASPDSPVRFGDPARVAAQILTGIGFIGAGTVLRHGPSIYGLTTAATLWISASIGMAVGTGDYFLATLTTIITILSLTLIRKLERAILRQHKKRFAVVNAVIECKSQYVDEVTNELYNSLENIRSLNKYISDEEKDTVSLSIKVTQFTSNPVKDVYQLINKINHIKSVTVEQATEEL